MPIYYQIKKSDQSTMEIGDFLIFEFDGAEDLTFEYQADRLYAGSYSGCVIFTISYESVSID
jgi:hypothetical protein